MAAWGAPGSGAGVDEWVEQLHNNDPKLTSIIIFRTRKFGHEVWLQLKSIVVHDVYWLLTRNAQTLYRGCIAWVYMPMNYTVLTQNRLCSPS